MQIQGRLIFSHDDVTCSPVNPALSGYTETLGFEDPALDFRLRLFGARISQAGPAAFVALVLPDAMVLRDDPAPEDDGQPLAPPFDGIPDSELHVIDLDQDGLPARIAVERIVLDEMIRFARHHGLCPLEVVIPASGGAQVVTLPVHGAGFEPAADGAPTPVVAQSDLRRELRRRKMKRVAVPATTADPAPEADRLPEPPAPVRLPAAVAGVVGPLADRLVPALQTPPDRAPVRRDPFADPPRRSEPLASFSALHAASRDRLQAFGAGLSVRARAALNWLAEIPLRIGRALHGATRSVFLPLARLDWHRLARPAPLAAASLLAIVGVAGAIVADRFAATGEENRVAAAPPEPAAPPPSQALSQDAADPAEPPVMAEVAVATPRPVPDRDIAARPDPQPVALLARGAATQPVDQPEVDLGDVILTATSTPAPVPSGSVPPAPAFGQDASRAVSVPSQAAAPLQQEVAAAPLPDAALALQPGTLAAVAAPTEQHGAPAAWSDTGPDASPPRLPDAPAPENAHAADIALPHVVSQIEDPAVTAQAAEEAQVAPLPQVAERVDPPAPAPVAASVPVVTASPAPAAVPVVATVATVVPPALSPERAPRPPVRPAALTRAADPAVAATTASAPRPAVAPVPGLSPRPRPEDTTPASAVAVVAPQPAAPPASAPALEVVPPGGASGLRVLAIVGAGSQRQALVQTGQSQTTVLTTGANLGSWWVVEVRRDGVLMANGERQRFLPFGS